MNSSLIPSKSYFLIAPVGYEYNSPVGQETGFGGLIIIPHMEHTNFSLSSTGGTVFLVNNKKLLTNNTATSSVVVDQLSYGTGKYLFPENTPALAPNSSQTLERKATKTSTADTLINNESLLKGNGYDSNNNANDFIIHDQPNPSGMIYLI
ncbi:MAG: hypothetical protein ABIF22_01925 [bacterium]